MSNDKFWSYVGILASILIVAGFVSAAIISPGQKLINQINKHLSQSAMVIKSYVRKRKTNPQIRKIASQLVSHKSPSDMMGQILEIFRFVHEEIKYIKDPYGIEHISDPIETLYVGAGDCDCKSLLLLTLLESIGYKCYMVFIKPLIDIKRAKVLREGHAFVVVKTYKLYDINYLIPYRNGIPSEYVIPLESTIRNLNVGWIPEEVINAIQENRYMIIDPETQAIDEGLSLKLI